MNINLAIVAMVKYHPHAHNVTAGACPLKEPISDGINSPVFPSMKHDEKQNMIDSNLTYDWTPRTQGIILGSFWYSYMCMQVPAARMAEDMGGKAIVAASLIGSSVINFITPLVTGSIAALVTSRVVLGVLQGGIFPSCYAMLYKWMPQRERSFALACMDLGGIIGSVVAASLTGYLSEHGFAGGWPSSFYVSGLIAGVTFIIWLACTQSVPENHSSISSDELRYIQQTRGTGENAHEPVRNKIRRPPVPWRAIFTSAPVLAVAASRFSLGWTFFTILSKLPAYLNDVLHIAPTEVNIKYPNRTGHSNKTFCVHSIEWFAQCVSVRSINIVVSWCRIFVGKVDPGWIYRSHKMQKIICSSSIFRFGCMFGSRSERWLQ